MKFSKPLNVVRQVWPYIPRFRKCQPWDVFHSNSYLEHTSRRLEHLSSLNIDFEGKSVLELGAGIGDLTGYFLSRSCKVTSTDSRPELVKLLHGRFKDIQTCVLDIEQDSKNGLTPHQIVFSYGVLYHLSNPGKALELMSNLSSELLVLETCVSVGGGIDNNIPENSMSFSQATSGLGSRPNRQQLFLELKKHFSYVYLPITQPRHPEFPLDWNAELPALSRAVFICSRTEISNPNLTLDFLQQHEPQI